MVSLRFSLLVALLFPSSALLGDDAPKWYKGNLHTHSLWSDGNDFPEMIADWYASRDYNFLALSDHNILSKGLKWMNVRDINKRGNVLALDKYLARFGKEWVEVRGEDPMKEVRLKGLEEFRGKVEKPGFIMIQGEELSDKFGKLPVHMNATNIQEVIKPQGGTSVPDVLRRNLAAIEEQARRLGVPILQHLNHPNFVWGVTAEDIAEVLEEQFFEVFNGHPGVNQNGDATHASIDKLWDIANTLRIAKLKARPLYGLGTDDSQHYQATQIDATNMKRSESGRGWVMVRAKKLDAESLIEAMKAGDFYASSGVTLREVKFADDTISIEIAPDGDAEYVTRFIGTLKGYDDASSPVNDAKGEPLPVTRKYSEDVGKVLAELKGLKPTYKLTGQELYVRAVVISSKAATNPSLKDQKQQAWTQPVGWQKWLEKGR